MLTGNINHAGTYTPFLSSPVWIQALEWLKTEAEGKEDGEYEIQGRDMYASVQTIQTLPKNEGLFEAHKQYIDIHYCLTGGELIGWIPVQQLTNEKESNPEKDYTLFFAPEQYTDIHMTPGTFSVLFPEDAHMPKVSDGNNTEVKKVVIKVNVDLVK